MPINTVTIDLSNLLFEISEACDVAIEDRSGTHGMPEYLLPIAAKHARCREALPVTTVDEAYTSLDLCVDIAEACAARAGMSLAKQASLRLSGATNIHQLPMTKVLRDADILQFDADLRMVGLAYLNLRRAQEQDGAAQHLLQRAEEVTSCPVT